MIDKFLDCEDAILIIMNIMKRSITVADIQDIMYFLKRENIVETEYGRLLGKLYSSDVFESIESLKTLNFIKSTTKMIPYLSCKSYKCKPLYRFVTTYALTVDGKKLVKDIKKTRKDAYKKIKQIVFAYLL